MAAEEAAAAEKEAEAKAAAEKAAAALNSQQHASFHRQPSMREALITALASSNPADLKAALDTALAMGLPPTGALATLATQQLAALSAKEAQHEYLQREAARQQALEALGAALADGAAAAELERAAAAAREAGVSPDDAGLKAAERELSGARLLELFERPPSDLDWEAAVKVGAGGFGNVYRVPCAGIVVAAKKLQMDTRAEAMELLRRETRVLAKAPLRFKLYHAL